MRNYVRRGILCGGVATVVRVESVPDFDCDGGGTRVPESAECSSAEHVFFLVQRSTTSPFLLVFFLIYEIARPVPRAGAHIVMAINIEGQQIERGATNARCAVMSDASTIA